MNSEKILDSLNDLNDNLINTTYQLREKNSSKRKIIKYGVSFASVAACFCLVFVLISLVTRTNTISSNNNPATNDTFSGFSDGASNKDEDSKAEESKTDSECDDSKFDDTVNDVTPLTSKCSNDISTPATAPDNEAGFYINITVQNHINNEITAITTADNNNYSIPANSSVVVYYDNMTKLLCTIEDVRINDKLSVLADSKNIETTTDEDGKKIFRIHALIIHV